MGVLVGSVVTVGIGFAVGGTRVGVAVGSGVFVGGGVTVEVGIAVAVGSCVEVETGAAVTVGATVAADLVGARVAAGVDVHAPKTIAKTTRSVTTVSERFIL